MGDEPMLSQHSELNGREPMLGGTYIWKTVWVPHNYGKTTKQKVVLDMLKDLGCKIYELTRPETAIVKALDKERLVPIDGSVMIGFDEPWSYDDNQE